MPFARYGSNSHRFHLEYRHVGDSGWSLNSSTDDEPDDACRQYVESNWGNRWRAFVMRLRDTHSGHIYVQYGLNNGLSSWEDFIPKPFFNDDEEYPNIVWNSPNSRQLTGEIRHMIKVGVRRIGGKLMLLVNAAEFHDELDKIGVAHDGSKYLDQPPSSSSVATSSFQMSPQVLLRRDYKDVEVTDLVGTEKVTKKVPVTCAADLTGIWANPPSFEQLKKLCNSANDAARKCLEHYQPIDISVEIHKKVVK